MKVKLKKPSEIDFNKTSGRYHEYYDYLKDRFGLQKIFIANPFDCYGTKYYELKDLNGNIITEKETSSNKGDFLQSMFKPA